MGRHSVMICPGVAIGALESGLLYTLSLGLRMQKRASHSKVSAITETVIVSRASNVVYCVFCLVYISRFAIAKK